MRRSLRWLLWLVLGPLGVALVVAAAWVASNGRWADVAPRPLPAELQPRPLTLAPADNAFFDIQGLQAPAGESPNAWGQRSWRGEVDEAALLALPSGDDWHCKADCLARWRGAAAALTAQMSAAPTLGERCHALAARTGLQEPPPARRARPQDGKPWEVVPLARYSAATTCLRWLQIEAVLATDAAGAQTAWARADALLRLLGSGTQTLIGQAITWNQVLRHQQLLAAWSAAQPAGTRLPAAWLAPWPQGLLRPQAWMAAESQYQREILADLRDHGGRPVHAEEGDVLQWLASHQLGFLPQLTEQALAARWLAEIGRLGRLEGPALALAARSSALPEDGSWWRHVRWRNTVGQVLIEVAGRHHETYLLRQADLALSQAALSLSQQLNDVPATERAGWWARQPIDAALRERLGLEGDAALVVRTWRGEADGEAPLRFPLRPA